MKKALTFKDAPVTDYRFSGTKRGKTVSGTIRNNSTEREALDALKRARIANVTLTPIRHHTSTFLQ